MKFSEHSFVVQIDSREQTPWSFSHLRTEPAMLVVGDYSIAGLADQVAIERKSLDDLLACCGVEKTRFDSQMNRLLGRRHRLLIVEAPWQELEAGNWLRKISAKSVTGQLIALQTDGLPIHFAASHADAALHAERWLFTVARRRYHELQQLTQVLLPTEQKSRLG